MSRISIVGVDGSGKTVLMAAFGEKYERPDGYGYFLSANTPQTFHTVKMLMDRMRHGQWPNATGAETVTNLDWTLLQRKGGANESICSVSFLDYAGEIYRLAFGEHTEEEREPYKEQIKTLYDHVSSSDALLVLINLKDIVSGDLGQAKTRETLWISRNIFDYAAEKHPGIRMALAFSQFDVYRAAIENAGGLEAAYRSYLSHIESLYPEMQLLSVSAVNRTEVNEDGFEVPARDFDSEGLDALLEWIVSTVPGHEGEIAYRRNLPKTLWEKLFDGRRALDSGSVSINADRLKVLQELNVAIEEFRRLPDAERQSVAADAKLREMSQYISEEAKKAGALESVVQTARKHGLDAAENALMEVAEREACSKSDLARIREEIAEAVRAAEAADRRARFCRRMIAAGIVVSLAVAAVVGGLKVHANIEAERERARIQREAEERRRRIAEQKELERKRDAGYVIETSYGKKSARWESGRVPPVNANLLTTSLCEEYRSTRAGYEWVRGTLTDAWKPGLRYPGKEDVIAGEREGQWVSTKPGYAVDGNFNLIWQAGLTHPQNRRLESTSSEGCWKSTEAGWKWNGGATTVWQVGVKHPYDGKLVSTDEEGKWKATEAGYVWDGGNHAIWKSGMRHPLNNHLVSAEREGVWKSDRIGYSWAGGSEEKWNVGSEHPKHPHVVASKDANNWHAAPGYTWVAPDDKDSLDVKWNPGVVVDGRKASSTEGRWLGKVSCRRCDGSGKIESYENCSYCNGNGRRVGRVRCSSCGGAGSCSGNVRCSACNGLGMAMRTVQMPCMACGGRGWIGQQWNYCMGCWGRKVTQTVSYDRCGSCNGTGAVSSQVRCGSCNGSGEVSGYVDCDYCTNGRRKVRSDCPNCDGGKVWESE